MCACDLPLLEWSVSPLAWAGGDMVGLCRWSPVTHEIICQGPILLGGIQNMAWRMGAGYNWWLPIDFFQKPSANLKSCTRSHTNCQKVLNSLFLKMSFTPLLGLGCQGTSNPHISCVYVFSESADMKSIIFATWEWSSKRFFFFLNVKMGS